jgi:xanthine dehydrogenase YagT iron-sulfur-binding subunit
MQVARQANTRLLLSTCSSRCWSVRRVVDGGERILSCMVLAVQYEGRAITTIEGLAANGEMPPAAGLRRARRFPVRLLHARPNLLGRGMADELRRGVPSHVTADLSAETIALSHDELRERMSGNLCRCGAYNGIVDAIAEVHAETHAEEVA